MHAWNCTGCEPVAEIVASGGCYLYDRQGNGYVDLEAGVWCASLGHRHPDIDRALREQAGKISHIGYRFASSTVERAAGMLAARLQLPDGKCVFLSSGSEAVEFAVQAAKTLRDRPHILCLQGYFLSSYGQSATRPAEEWIALDFSDSNVARCLRQIDRLDFDQIGAFVFEPGNASGTVRLPPEPIVTAIAHRVRESGGLLVVDEVTTGIGRTGKWFGFEHYSLSPDLVAVGKGVGGGYPVSAVAMRGDLADTLLAAGFHYAQSHQNDPLGCAVVCAVLARIEQDGLIAHAEQIGAYFLQQLRTLADETPWIHAVRGRGLMLAIGLSAAAPAAQLHRALCEKGYVVGLHAASRSLRIYPPLIVDRAIVDGFVGQFREVLRTLHR